MTVKVDKILIIRLSAIGDIVMASPLITAFRQRYPQAHIAWLVQSEAYDLLAANKQLDNVIVWPRNQWRDLWRQRRLLSLIKAIFQFVRDLRQQRFDLVLDVQGLLKSGIWAWFTGARQRIGLGSREGSAHLMTRVITKPQGDIRISSEYRKLAAQLGLDVAHFDMRIALSDEDEIYAEQLCRQHQMNQGYIVICPFTTRPQKHWFEHKWIEFIRQAHEQLALPIVLLGGPADADAAGHLDQGQPGLINLVGQTRLRQAAAIIGRARLLVGVDTGLTHMGIAAATPVIALFGSTCPYRDAGRTDSIILYKALACSPCRRKPTCDGAYTCMDDISVFEVLVTVQQLLHGEDNENPAR